MSLAFKEDDVLVIDVPGCSPQSPDETCSVSYDNQGRIVRIANDVSGVTEVRAYYTDCEGHLDQHARAICTFFDRDNNFLLSKDTAC